MQPFDQLVIRMGDLAPGEVPVHCLEQRFPVLFLRMELFAGFVADASNFPGDLIADQRELDVDPLTLFVLFVPAEVECHVVWYRDGGRKSQALV